jgi:predicted DNA-binding transcriptional regulator YafY
MIQFMRDLQALRSTGVAHRKGENYQKIKKGFDLNDDNFKETFDEILIKSIRILNTLKTKLLENHT